MSKVDSESQLRIIPEGLLAATKAIGGTLLFCCIVPFSRRLSEKIFDMSLPTLPQARGPVVVREAQSEKDAA